MTDKQAREAFEAWWDKFSYGFYPKKNAFGVYESPLVTSAWSAWQAASQQNSGWQDISTAPKDGTSILVTLVPTIGHDNMAVAKWNGKDWGYCEECQADFTHPTHWMPLPPKPNEQALARHANLNKEA